MQCKLCCLYTNIDGLSKTKGDELNIAINHFKPHIVFITETKMDETQVVSQFIECSGYTVFRRDRGYGRGGGVLILVKDYIIARDSADQYNVECVSCQLTFGQHTVNLACMYRPPNADANYNEATREALKKLSNKHGQVVICGDFNFPQINWMHNTVQGGMLTEQSKFYEATQDAFLQQHVNLCTRVRGSNEPSLLDLILTRNSLEVDNLKYKSPIGASDHCLLVFDLLIEGNEPQLQADTKKKFFKGNYEEANNMFADINWIQELGGKDVQAAWDIFMMHYNAVVDHCVPTRMNGPNRKHRKKKWMTRKVMEDTQRKEHAWDRYRKSKSKTHLNRYRKIRNKATKSVREAKYLFETKLAKEAKTNPKAFYAYARSKTSIKEQVLSVKNKNGADTKTLEEACEVINEEFEKVFTRTAVSPPWSVLTDFQGEKLTQVEITRDEVEKTLRSLKPSAPGPDGVHPVVLLHCATSLSTPLTTVFQASLKQGRVPKDWTRANVTPIYKKGSRSDPLNYRPISLTSVACKTLERLIRTRLISHLEESGLLSIHQHGFRSGMSCLTQLLEYLCELENAMDDGDSVDSVYLDCAKAFDSVPHDHLLAKLWAAGIEGPLAHWIRSFLTNREQRVCIKGTRSSWRKVRSGVPQGSVLGPTLFLTYINDLLDGLQSGGKLFADDAKIFRRIKCPEDRQRLQADLDKLQEWSNRWLLKFNEKKCTVLNIGKRNPKYTYRMGGAQLAHSEQEKDLGVLITTDLKPAMQVARAAAAANSMLGRIKSTLTCLSEETLLPLYKALVRPRMEFAIQAWSPYLKKDIMKLEKVQRRATKLVPSLSHLPYEERLQRLGLTTLEKRRTRGDMIQTFKILKGFDRIKTDCAFLALDHGQQGTRGHSMKLIKPRHRTQKRNEFFPSRVVDKWNCLPETVIQSENVNQFKRRFDKYMLTNNERRQPS